MGEATSIEWCDHTFNPWTGCTHVSPGCANCYAELQARRFAHLGDWGPGATRRRTAVSNWAKVFAWDRKAELAIALGARRPRVFCASFADVFDLEVPAEWLADLLALIAETPNLDWLLVTKRPQLWRQRLETAFACSRLAGEPRRWLGGEAPHNVWLGVSVEDQQRADERLPYLLQIPARVRFLSCEPLLGPVDLTRRWGLPSAMSIGADGKHAIHSEPEVHWVICGGESGPKARPMHPDWARSLRDQCQAAGVPFLFKQWGEWRPKLAAVAGSPEPVARGKGWGTLNRSGDWSPTATPWNGRQLEDSQDGQEVVMVRVGKKKAGRLLDGRVWDEFPAVEVA